MGPAAAPALPFLEKAQTTLHGVRAVRPKREIWPYAGFWIARIKGKDPYENTAWEQYRAK
jgi:hypothetical protein